MRWKLRMVKAPQLQAGDLTMHFPPGAIIGKQHTMLQVCRHLAFYGELSLTCIRTVCGKYDAE